MLLVTILGVVLIALSVVLILFPEMTYRFIDATSGRAAKWAAQAGYDLSWRHYRWHRPVLRFGWPLLLFLAGTVFLLKALVLAS